MRQRPMSKLLSMLLLFSVFALWRTEGYTPVDSALRLNMDPTGKSINFLTMTICPYHSASGDPFGLNDPSGNSGALWSIQCKAGYYDNGLARSFLTGSSSPSLSCSTSNFAGSFTVSKCKSIASPLASYSGIQNGTFDFNCGLGSGYAFSTCYCSFNFLSFQRAAACVPCPTGTFGSTNGLVTSSCSGQCAAGRFGSAKAMTN